MAGATKDYYVILRISPLASADEVKEAYRCLAAMFHPDRFDRVREPNKWTQANGLMADLNEAYSVLRDPARRADYDEQHRHARNPREATTVAGRKDTATGEPPSATNRPPTGVNTNSTIGQESEAGQRFRPRRRTLIAATLTAAVIFVLVVTHSTGLNSDNSSGLTAVVPEPAPLLLSPTARRTPDVGTLQNTAPNSSAPVSRDLSWLSNPTVPDQPPMPFVNVQPSITTWNRPHSQWSPEPPKNVSANWRDMMSVEPRAEVANQPRGGGLDYDWRKNSFGDMLDAESRIDAANRLRVRGLNYDWRKNSLGDMLDAESRIDAATRLRGRGLDYDWRKNSLGDMLDAESRIDAADRLRGRGLNYDWRKNSLGDMLDAESRIDAANRLRNQ